MRFQHVVLDNGLTIIGEENPNALSMSGGYFVRTGARDETAEVSGVSHFLEHMLFKGTDRRTAEDVNREFDEMGADYNAFTGEEYTVYYGAVLPEQQTRLLDLLTDLMHPTLREEDFTVEKQVILEEIAMYKDRPQFTVVDEARSFYYEGHPLGQSVLGTAESITALQRDQMHAYWQRRYAPNNLLLTLTGNFSWREAVEHVERQSRKWSPADSPRPFPRFEAQSRVKVIPNDKIHRVHLCFVSPGVPAQSEERRIADLITDMLGGGDGSRLYWELVEPGLADSVRQSHDEEDGSGAFFGYASCGAENAQEVVDRIRKVLRVAMDGGFTEDELERTKRKAASALVIHDETPRGRLFHVGFDWQYRAENRPLDEVIDQYLAISLDDVRRFLDRRPFDALTLLALGPITSLS
ncbi:MAG: peptidase domain protein [Armatimonadetes bacterium]|jgi:predicted Zn-dependent peptidase|nr:peptidase domain protein [Armatimonadota bacterium]